MTRHAATLCFAFVFSACCLPDALSLIFKGNLMRDAFPSAGHSTVCSSDTNSSHGDFACFSRTCFNRTSGLVTTYRVSCHRVRNRLLPFDERSRELIRVSQIPMNAVRMIIKGVWKDWLGVQFIEFLARRIKFM